MNRAATAVLGVVLLSAAGGCRALRGPAWSPDGRFLAYTSYRFSAGDRSAPPTGDLYVLEAAATDPKPRLLARGAGRPAWDADGRTLYFLGDQNKQGFYTVLYRARPFATEGGGGGGAEAVLNLGGKHPTDLQLSYDGKVALLCMGDSPAPDAPCSLMLWLPKENKQVSLDKLGKVYSPALAPDGRTLFFAARTGNGGGTTGGGDGVGGAGMVGAAVFSLELDGSNPRQVFPKTAKQQTGAGSYLIYPLPDNARFLFYAPGEETIWVVRRDGSGLRRRAKPPGLRGPVMVSIADDSKSAVLTMARSTADGPRFSAFNLDLVRDSPRGRKGWKRLTAGTGGWFGSNDEAAVPFGGHAVAPGRHGGGKMRAWLSPAGLALERKDKTKFFPLTAREALAAAEAYAKMKRTDEALLALKLCRFLIERDGEEGVRAAGGKEKFDAAAAEKTFLAVKAEYLEAGILAAAGRSKAGMACVQALLLYPVRPEGLPLFFRSGNNFTDGFGLPPTAPAATAATEKLLNAAVSAARNDRLLLLLKTAFTQRRKGNPGGAATPLLQGEPLAGDERLTGGLKFLQGLVALESGAPGEAAPKLEAAARTPDWPQAAYAAGLAAVAYALEGSARSKKKVAELLEFGTGLGGPTAADFAALKTEASSAVWGRKKAGKEVPVPGKATRVWFEREEYSVPRAALRPFFVAGEAAEAGAGARPRLSAVETRIVSRLRFGEPGKRARTAVVVPALTSPPVVSPGGDYVAFAVVGDVFPVSPAPCRLYVVSFSGRFLIGNEKALAAGAVSGREIIKTVEWKSEAEVEISGVAIDPFGREKPFHRTERLGAKQ